MKSIERLRMEQEFIDAIMSMNAEQLAEYEVVFNFVFSLPKHQQAEAAKLYADGMQISDIIKRLAGDAA